MFVIYFRHTIEQFHSHHPPSHSSPEPNFYRHYHLIEDHLLQRRLTYQKSPFTYLPISQSRAYNSNSNYSNFAESTNDGDDGDEEVEEVDDEELCCDQDLLVLSPATKPTLENLVIHRYRLHHHPHHLHHRHHLHRHHHHHHVKE